MSADLTAQGERLTWAETLLREAVYRSRGQSASPAILDPGAPASGRCGLGEQPALDLELTPEGQAAFARLWPSAPAAEGLVQIRDTLADWVRAQDAIDRKRNHFLKAFRARHGSDRRAYGEVQRTEFEAGLQRINAEENSARRGAAERLCARTA